MEFERLDRAALLRTSRETTQPNLTDLLYWASGLSPVYLEGALGRAVEVRGGHPILTASNVPFSSAAAMGARIPDEPGPPPSSSSS